MSEEKEGEEKSEAISKYDRLSKHTDAIIDTTKRHHVEAYSKAVDDLLKEEGEKYPDFDKLKEEDIRKDFADKLSDFYISKAKDYFNVQGDLDELEKDSLMKAYAGTTKDTLKRLVDKHGEDLDIDTYKKETDNLVNEVEKTLKQTTRSHFTEEDKEDLLKEANAYDLVKPDAVNKEVAIEIYTQYRETGAMSKKVLKKSGIPEYILKEE